MSASNVKKSTQSSPVKSNKKKSGKAPIKKNNSSKRTTNASRSSSSSDSDSDSDSSSGSSSGSESDSDDEKDKKKIQKKNTNNTSSSSSTALVVKKKEKDYGSDEKKKTGEKPPEKMKNERGTVPEDEDAYDPVDENARTFFSFLFFFTFLASFNYTIILPSLYPLLIANNASDWLYLIAFAVYTLTEIISSELFTWWISTRTLQYPFLVGGLSAVVGNVVYCLQTSNENAYLTALSRGISGVGGGLVITGFAHIARHSVLRLRPGNIAYYRMGEVLGNLAGLAVGGFLVTANDSLYFLNADKFHFPSFLTACLFGLYLIILPLDIYCTQRKTWAVFELFARDEEQEEANSIALEDRENANFSLTSTTRRGALFYVYASIVAAFWAMIGMLLPGAIPQSSPSDSSGWSDRSNYGIFVVITFLHVGSIVVYKVFFLKEGKFPSPRHATMSMLIMISGLMLMNGGIDAGNTDPTNIQKYITASIVTIGFSIASVQVSILAVHGNPVRLKKTNTFFAFASIPRAIGLGCGAYGYDRGGYSLVTHASAAMLASGLIISFSFLTSKDLALRSLVTNIPDRKNIKSVNESSGATRQTSNQHQTTMSIMEGF